MTVLARTTVLSLKWYRTRYKWLRKTIWRARAECHSHLLVREKKSSPHRSDWPSNRVHLVNCSNNEALRKWRTSDYHNIRRSFMTLRLASPVDGYQ